MVKLSTLADEKFGNEQGFEVDFSHLTAKLPTGVPLDRIDVDVETVLKICDLTRVDSLSVLGFDEKGQDRFVIHDVGGDGSIAGHANTAGLAHKLDIGRPSAFVRAKDFIPAIGRSVDFRRASVFVNVSEVSDLGNLHDPAVFSKFLDDVLKKQLWKIAKKRLGFDIKSLVTEIAFPPFLPVTVLSVALKSRNFFDSFMFFCLMSFLSLALDSDTVLEGLGKGYMIVFLLSKMIFALHKDPNLPDDLRKSSVNPWTLGDFEYDRLGPVWNLLRTKTLVSAAVEDRDVAV